MPPILEKRVPLLDLHAQHSPIRDEIFAAIARVFDSQQFIMGQEVEELEKEIAAYTGVPFAIGMRLRFGRALPGSTGGGDRSGRHRPHDAVLLFRHGGLDFACGRDASLRRYPTGHLQHRPGPSRRPNSTLGKGDYSRAPFWSLRRYGPHYGDRDRMRGDGHRRWRASNWCGVYGAKSSIDRPDGLHQFFPHQEPRCWAMAAWFSPAMKNWRQESLAYEYTDPPKNTTINIGTNSRLDTLQAAVLRVKLRYLYSMEQWPGAQRRLTAPFWARGTSQSRARAGLLPDAPCLQPVRHPGGAAQ